MSAQQESGSSNECIDHGRVGFGLGYATSWVIRNGLRRCTTLHRKIHYEETGEWPEVVRHTCDNPRCINPQHLVGGTQVDNMRDMLERGRAGDARNFGESNGRCILSNSDVEAVLKTYIKGSRTNGLRALASQYGCGTSQIFRIVHGQQRKTT